jgi:antitoxin VapB
MPLNIKNQEADDLARELARRTGRSITEAVIAALHDSLTRETARARPRNLGEDLREIGRRCAALPDLDRRSAEEIIGYNEIGVPR